MKLELEERQSSRNSEKVVKLRRLIDKLAYGSLVLDICIAIVTALSLFQISEPGFLLMPVNILLTIVVILSIGSGVLIVFLEHYEKILTKTLNIRDKIKDKIAVLMNSRNKYHYRLGKH